MFSSPLEKPIRLDRVRKDLSTIINGKSDCYAIDLYLEALGLSARSLESLVNNRIANFMPLMIEAATIGRLDLIELLFAKYHGTLQFGFLLGLAECPFLTIRWEIKQWLLDGEKYKLIDSKLTLLHMRAFGGEYHQEIMESHLADSRGLTPTNYVQLYGYTQSRDRNILDLFEPTQIIQTGKYKGQRFTSLLAEQTGFFLRDLCTYKPNMMTWLDLDSLVWINDLLSPTLAHQLCISHEFDLVIKIAMLNKSQFSINTQAKAYNSKLHSLSACALQHIYAFRCAACVQRNSTCLSCAVKKGDAKRLINYILENIDASISLTEQFTFGDDAGETVGSFLARHDTQLLNKIILGTRPSHNLNVKFRATAVNLNEINKEGETLIYSLARRRHFKTIELFYELGNTQLSNVYEAHGSQKETLIALFIKANQWLLIRMVLTRRFIYDYSVDFISPVMDNLTFEEAINKYAPAEEVDYYQELKKRHPLYAASQASKILAKETNTQPVPKNKVVSKVSAEKTAKMLPILDFLPKPAPAPELTPLEKLQNQLTTLLHPIDIKFELKPTDKEDVWQLILTGKESVLRPLTLIIKKQRKTVGPTNDKKEPSVMKTEVEASKLTVLTSIFTNNKVIKDIQTIGDKKIPPKPLAPLLDSFPTGTRVSLSKPEEAEWIKILHSAFCFAKEVTVAWRNEQFEISWLSSDNQWHVRGPKAAHEKFNVVTVDKIFIEEQILQRLKANFTATCDGSLTQSDNAIQIIPYTALPMSLLNMHVDVYKQFSIPVEASSLPITAPAALGLFPVKPSAVIAPVEPVDPDNIRNLFFKITQNTRCHELTCEAIKKGNKWRITYTQKGVFELFMKLFTPLLDVLNCIQPDTMTLHTDKQTCVVFHCDAAKLASFNEHIQLLQDLYVLRSSQKEPICRQEAVAEQVLTPAKIVAEPKVEVAAYSTHRPASVQSARAELVTAIKNMSNDKQGDIKRVNVEYHVEQVLAIQQQEAKNPEDKEILYYAYLLHLLRLFHILSNSAEKSGTIFHKWRNVLRHALETMCDDELIARVHPLIIALRDIAPNLKATSITLSDFFVPAVAGDKSLQLFVDGIQPYEALLEKQALGGQSESEKSQLIEQYVKIISCVAHSTLSEEIKTPALSLLSTLIGAFMGNRNTHRQAYREVGHHALNVPVNDFLDELLVRISMPVVFENTDTTRRKLCQK